MSLKRFRGASRNDQPAGRQVIRQHSLPRKLGVGHTTVAALIAAGAIRVFPLSPGGRAKVAFVDEIDAYLARQAAQASEGSDDHG